jgi:hypothetical protein
MSPAPLLELAQRFADIGDFLHEHGLSEADALAGITAAAVALVPGVQYASVSQGRAGRFVSVAATDTAAELIDAIQYQLGTGPCVDALGDGASFRTGDVASDPRWPEFGPRAFAVAGVRSMMAFRMFIEGDAAMIASLNVYSNEPDAFDETAQAFGLLVSTHGAMAVTTAQARDRSDHLNRAFRSNREIGVATGLLMGTHRLSRDQALSVLKVASQNANRRLADVAADVVGRGGIDLPV